MPHIRFNWVDIIFVTLLIRISYIGFRNGFLSEFLRALGLVSAFIFSFNGYTSLSSFISRHTRWTGPEPDVISFIFIFVFILFLFKIASMAIKIFFGGENVSTGNRVIGLLLGMGRGLLLIALVYILLVNGPFVYLSKSAEQRSFSGQYVSGIAPFVYNTSMRFYPWEKIDTPLAQIVKQ
ncbi:MAG: CvpA family protein [Candidatus Omnitrophica bacterium]|nr:CvpA family protein [Candidatus Omnitrophota bacterium]MBU4590904.1 CvpA family protein [Candidatus Omnitrophota bacterium]